MKTKEKERFGRVRPWEGAIWQGSGAMSAPSHTPPSIVTEAATCSGIDCHKKHSVWHAIDATGIIHS